MELARWVTCSCPYAFLINIRRYEPPPALTPIALSVVQHTHWMAAHQLAGRAASMVGRPHRRSTLVHILLPGTDKCTQVTDTKERPARAPTWAIIRAGEWWGPGCACV